MLNVKQIAKNLGGKLSKNSPQILTGLGCAGVVSTAILASRGTITAQNCLDEYYYATRNFRDDKCEDLTVQETIKAVWKCYIPAFLVGSASIACIIGANKVNAKRHAALAALYSMSEVAFREYQEKVIETIGKKKEQTVRDNIAQDRVANIPPRQSGVIMAGNGKVLCVDMLSGRTFESDYESIRQAIGDFNQQLRHETWLDLNELYYLLGLPPNDFGSLVGFDIENGNVEAEFSSCLTPEGRPCLALDFSIKPKYFNT